MKAKEKAKELVGKFRMTSAIVGFTVEKNARINALICVDGKIESLLPYAGLLDIKKDVEELEEVKQEIEKL